MNYSLIDGHCDTIVKLLRDKGNLYCNNKHLDIKRLKEYQSALQFFAIWLNPSFYPIALKQTIKSIDFYYQQVGLNKEFITHVNTYEEICKNKTEGKVSALLSLEGGEALEGELSSLRMFYRLGVRAMTLTWNHRNELADGVAERETKGGLTVFGKEVVKEMNRLGMIVDVSHLSEAGFCDVEKIAEKPYIASHSNAKAICDVPRNLSDTQIKAIAERGGMIGINLYPPFVAKKEKVNIEDIMLHIDYIIKLVGADILGLGCDFDGIDSSPIDICQVSDIKKLLEQIERKYGASIAEKIAEKNYMRFLKEILQ